MLSASRIPAALVLLAIYDPADAVVSGICIALLVFIAITDALDGALARRWRIQSRFGYIIDGIGDRAVLVTAYEILLLGEVIPALLAWLLILREILQYAVRLAEPDWMARVDPWDRRITRLYLITVLTCLFAEMARNLLAAGPPAGAFLIVVNAALTIAVLAAYSRILPRLAAAWRNAVEP